MTYRTTLQNWTVLKLSEHPDPAFAELGQLTQSLKVSEVMLLALVKSQLLKQALLVP